MNAAPKIFKALKFSPKEMWKKHGIGGQFRALTGIGTAGGFLGLRTLGIGAGGILRAQGLGLLHGSGSHMRIPTRKQLKQHRAELMQQLDQARARAVAAGMSVTDPNKRGLRNGLDRATGEARFEPPADGNSMANWRRNKFEAMQLATNRGLGPRSLAPAALHPPPM